MGVEAIPNVISLKKLKAREGPNAPSSFSRSEHQGLQGGGGRKQTPTMIDFPAAAWICANRMSSQGLNLLESRSSRRPEHRLPVAEKGANIPSCRLYTSDDADEEDSVALGGRRISEKKTLIQ